MDEQRLGRICRVRVESSDKQMAAQRAGGEGARRAANALIRKFRWRLDREGVLADQAQTLHYEKPSDRKRRKRSDAERARARE